MSFSFNFDVHEHTAGPTDDVAGEEQHGKPDYAAKPTEDSTKPAAPVKEAKEHCPPPEPAAPLKEAKEHRPPPDSHLLLDDVVPETVTVGALPPLHFLNEAVFEMTALEREDGERILSHSAGQSSDLISGVYEGGLKVWECTYDLLELIERDGETFGEKRVLDLGCGAGLLGILALKRGASRVHFQDYNSTVIEQLTLPNVLLNCQEDGAASEDDEQGAGEGTIQGGDDCCKEKVKDEERPESSDGDPPPKKRAADPPQHSLLAKCRFFSGDWITFLDLVLKEEPSPQYDIIFTSETIYNTEYYPALHEALHRLLAPDGLVYLAAKSHYFGVGGGLHLFETFVEQRGVFSMARLWDVEEGLQRHVVGLRFKAAKAS